ncbi:hypothetical protein DdX_00191 [Ditylenchus destructor]|uniref:Uncharacterized protein n=1 Tax=Ditylenchus destructor TaxID=166010 RepID=A0AAD4NGX9_9BILA|nr:hypothetical protein DdX_00191 [Ditylenchus destructor]
MDPAVVIGADFYERTSNHYYKPTISETKQKMRFGSANSGIMQNLPKPKYGSCWNGSASTIYSTAPKYNKTSTINLALNRPTLRTKENVKKRLLKKIIALLALKDASKKKSFAEQYCQRKGDRTHSSSSQCSSHSFELLPTIVEETESDLISLEEEEFEVSRESSRHNSDASSFSDLQKDVTKGQNPYFTKSALPMMSTTLRSSA